MAGSNYDVVIVGAGCAGLSAAIGLAKAGFGVVVLEAAAYPGAENWSGCVYFCENLVHPSLLGPDGMDGLAWERRLVERGIFACNGHSLFGMKYRDSDAFQHCYTVLRPIFDHHLSQLALKAGVVLLNNTTAESLIREGNRVVGVATNRGPVYADLTFLAEGDASHLVTREGYERSNDPKQQPKFLHGIKQIIDLPLGGVEANFGLGMGEGAAYEIVLRNGSLRGQPVRLNMGGFIYTNRQSLSIGLVLPAEHLHQHFSGDPNLLMEWFENLPDLQPWLKNGTRGVFGAKLIRGGGAKDIPRMVDDGLAIGGAATGVGVDFPYPNYTGPATRMGLQIVEAAKAIRQAKGSFRHDELERHYLEPLKQTRYWQDVDYLRRWPGYVEKTRIFFGRNVDLALGSAFLWTRPKHWLPRRLTNWVKMVLQLAGPGQWRELVQEGRYLNRALRVAEVAGRPAFGMLLLHGWLNAVRDLVGRPRQAVPAAGEVHFVYSVAGSTEGVAVPTIAERWFRRFAPVLAAAAKHVYQNDDTPLPKKLRSATRLLFQQVNLLDALLAGVGAMAAAGIATVLLGFDWLGRKIGKRAGTRPQRGVHAQFAQAADRACDFTSLVGQAARNWEDRLGQLAYLTAKQSHIHLHWPQLLERKQDVVKDGLWHVCPAHVYEAKINPLGQLQIVVNFENCIKCETCWRTSDLVDWGRDGRHRFLYPVHSPGLTRLLTAMDGAGAAQPKTSAASARVEADATSFPLVRQLDRKLEELGEALDEEPRTIDPRRADYLLLLARYAQQLADALGNLVRHEAGSDRQQRLALIGTIAGKVSEIIRHLSHRKYAWAAASGRQVRQHHLRLLRQTLPSANGQGDEAPHVKWLQAEKRDDTFNWRVHDMAARLDEAFGPYAWRDLENDGQLTPPQEKVLQDLLREVPPLRSSNPAAGEGHGSSYVHARFRKALLAELGRRDPSLAYRAASQLWARDLAQEFANQILPKGSWAAFAVVANGEALFVPEAAVVVALVESRLVFISPTTPGVERISEGTLGLRGARLQRLRIAKTFQPDSATAVERNEVLHAWHILSAADLISIAFGMADQLTNRCVAHAASRVQFPGLFHDEQARDAIGKFGAVKQMLAEMGARRYLLETLDHGLSPTDLSDATAQRAALAKAVAAEALGTAPGSLSYNAGQIFGGTGYSEDDILSKYYRDAAAWRYLGQPNPAVWQEHGEELLRSEAAGETRLTALGGEDEIFDQVAQRQALQPELDQLRVLRTRLRAQLHQHAKTSDGQAAMLLARQDALLLASKALLCRTHARLEEGLSSELHVPFLRVWLEFVENAYQESEATSGGLPGQAATDTEASPPQTTTYAQLLEAPAAYDSGDFLCTPVDPLQPRYLPELLQTDPFLANADRYYRELLSEYFGKQTQNGQPYERLIEAWHRPSEEDLDFTRKHGFFRTLIPKDLGGEGKKKCEYYMLTSHGQVIADCSWSLAIQASTSIGTTPILLARDKDLPKARKDLAPFVGDTSLQKEIHDRLAALVQMVDTADPKLLQTPFLELQKRLDEAVFKRAVLKTLAHRFVESWSQAARAGKALDLLTFRARVSEAQTAWREACDRAPVYHDELQLRQVACDITLRWIAAGQISAFALTEPSAGSDTARVATRAKPRSVKVESLSDGTFRFVPHGGTEPRILLDARRLEFRPDGAYYRFSAHVEPGRIGFDEYDYETDDPAKRRYFVRDGERVHFDDIALLRQRNNEPYYDYWELTGAKMWITNGRICGLMSLYAKTEEGVTGFIVDRHAEGLVIGKDEAKMGQNGSPTNEVSLEAVRVPLENVLGLEGRGQVNALETLNVGRAGIAMSAVAQIKSIIAMSREFLDRPQLTSHQLRLDRMAEDCFAAEAVAFETIGRFEHKQTKSVRMESAIAKMLGSELLHSVLELAEDVHGLEGQTRRHLIEKRKRDARILNIYEGTNEVQRFLILKELVGEVLPRWQGPAPKLEDPVAAQIQSFIEELRQRLASAAQVFGGGLWQNPNLQADGFLLSEAAAWIKAMDSVAARQRWLEGQRQDASLARRTLARCAGEVRRRLKRFDAALERLKHGRYSETVRAAELMFRDDHAKSRVIEPKSHITKPLSVLVIVEPTAGNVPKPLVRDGQLLEPFVTLTDADRSAIETALRLRDQDGQHVRITVAAVGPPRLAPLLREVQALGVSRTFLLANQEPGPLAADQAADALAAVLRRRQERFDLIVGPSRGLDVEEGLIAPMAARALDIAFAGAGAGLVVRHTATEEALLLRDAEGKRTWTRTLPAAVSIEAGATLRSFTTNGYFEGLSSPVEIEAWPAEVKAEPFKWIAAVQTAAAAEKPPRPLQTNEAAELLREQLGLHAETAPAGGARQFTIHDMQFPEILDGSGALAVVAAEASGRLSASALALASAVQPMAATIGRPSAVLLLATADESAEQSAVAQLVNAGVNRVAILAHEQAASSAEIRSRLLAEAWPALSKPPAIILGEHWAEPAFIELRQRSGRPGSVILRAKKVDAANCLPGIETARANGRLRTERFLMALDEGKTYWVSAADDVEVVSTMGGTPSSSEVRVERWAPQLEKLFGSRDMQRLLAELKEEAGVVRLADADFILDVGYGVGNRDGYEEVILPLEQALRTLGVRNVQIGGSRKVTEELHLLPPDRQIGQSGVSVNPRILLAIGVSGAPQHLNYIGPRATIISFNRDPEAPLMTLNQRQPRPKVFPVIGDLFQTVPAFVAALKQEKR